MKNVGVWYRQHIFILTFAAFKDTFTECLILNHVNSIVNLIDAHIIT